MRTRIIVAVVLAIGGIAFWFGVVKAVSAHREASRFSATLSILESGALSEGMVVADHLGQTQDKPQYEIAVGNDFYVSMYIRGDRVIRLYSRNGVFFAAHYTEGFPATERWFFCDHATFEAYIRASMQTNE